MNTIQKLDLISKNFQINTKAWKSSFGGEIRFIGIELELVPKHKDLYGLGKTFPQAVNDIFKKIFVYNRKTKQYDRIIQ